MTYDYECINEKCKNHYGFIEEASMSDPVLENCPICACKVNRVYKVSPLVKWTCTGNYGVTKHN